MYVSVDVRLMTIHDVILCMYVCECCKFSFIVQASRNAKSISLFVCARIAVAAYISMYVYMCAYVCVCTEKQQQQQEFISAEYIMFVHVYRKES